MKKKILKIKQSGLLFKFDGKSFRTPVSIDITYLPMDRVIAQLKSYGISKYEIVTLDSENAKDKDNKEFIINIKPEWIEKIDECVKNISKIDSQLVKFESLFCRLDKLEGIVSELASKIKELNREQNIKVNSESEKNNSNKIKSEKIKKENKDKNKSEIKKTQEPKIVKPKTTEVKEKSFENIPSKKTEDKIDLDVNKKVVIEELEDHKDFILEEIDKPFNTSSDIEELKKFKK